METLAIVATKGGVGKTTLAVHLAVASQRAGRKTMLIDLDPQGSAAQWGRDRQKFIREKGAWLQAQLDVKRAFHDELADLLSDAETSGYDFVIIDTPPHTDFPAARAVEVADLVLMPVRPGCFDLHASKATITLLRDLKTPAFFVVNQVPHNNLRLASDATSYLEAKGIAPAPAIVTLLQPYVRALRNGLTAPELVPDGRHATEIGELWDFVSAQCAMARAARPAVRKPAPEEEAPMLLGDFLDDILPPIPTIKSNEVA